MTRRTSRGEQPQAWPAEEERQIGKVSKERELLERMSKGKYLSGPWTIPCKTLERFQVEAKDIMESLNWLVANDFMCC